MDAIKEKSMAKKTAADIMVESLIDWGVEIIFGYSSAARVAAASAA